MALRKTGSALRRRGALLGATVSSTGSGAVVTPPPVGGTDFGIGMIGQSNMVNAATTYSGVHPLGHPDAYEWTGSLWRRIGNIGTGAYAGADKAGTPKSTYSAAFATSGSLGDGPIYLANLIASGLGVRSRVINKAVGNTSITEWLSVANGGPADNGTSTSGNRWHAFERAVIAAAEALGTTAAALLKEVQWLQGETNAAGMSLATMKTNLGLLHGQCKALAGNSAEFRFGVIALGPGKFNGSAEGDFGKMRLAHVEYATTTPGAYLASCAYDATTTDTVHMLGESFSRIFRRSAKAALAQRGIYSTGRGGSGAGPRIDGANVTRSGLTVTVPVLHAGGNALQLGAADAGVAAAPFRAWDTVGGVTSAITISSATISGPSAITLTLASLPAGTLTLTHAVTDAPCDPVWGSVALRGVDNARTGAIAFNPAACIYDNDGYSVGTGTASTTLGSPLQPWSGTVTGS